MKSEVRASNRRAAGIFKALGHAARLEMVRRLSEGELCVCELVESVGLGWSTVSRHLAVLREAGVVEDEKRGLQVYYRLAMPCITRFVRCLDAPESEAEWLQSGCGYG